MMQKACALKEMQGWENIVKDFLRVYSRVLKKITGWVGILAGVLLFIPAFSIGYEVVSRSLFNKPTEWAIELSTYCVLMAGFLGLGVALAAGKHIHVDMFTSRLSERSQGYLRVVTTLIGVIFSAVFFGASAEIAWLAWDFHMIAASTLRVPLWIPRISMPVGGAVLLLQFIRLFLESLVRLSDPSYRSETFGIPAADDVLRKEAAK
jgi:C4-dicarboxylate transporter, DctQ subunit